MWNNNSWHQLHFGTSLWLNCSIINVANTFNSVSKGVIFQEIYAIGEDIIQLIPFVCAFYTFEFPMFYRHHNRDGNVPVIPFVMGIYQNDHLRRVLFALTNLRALCSIINNFPSCLFPSTTYDIHIINPLPLYPLYMNIFKLNSIR